MTRLVVEHGAPGAGRGGQHQKEAPSADRWHSVSDLANPCGPSRHQLASEKTTVGHRVLGKRSEGKKLCASYPLSPPPCPQCLAWNLAHSRLQYILVE